MAPTGAFATAASHGSVNRSLPKNADCVAPANEYAVPTTKDALAPSMLAAMFCPVFVKTKSSMKFRFVLVVLTETLYGYGESGVDVDVDVVDGVAVCVAVDDGVSVGTVPVGVNDGVAPTDSVAEVDGVADAVSDGDDVTDDVIDDVSVIVGDNGTIATAMD